MRPRRLFILVLETVVPHGDRGVNPIYLAIYLEILRETRRAEG